MPRDIRIAAVQMDATPAPAASRLERAAALIAGAAQAGGQLVVLPELFNTGYEYSEQNYSLAEPLNGQTVTWMKAQAARHGVHLAGSLLLLDTEDIYNAALLIAPDGRTWRYDKNYPWLWERAYFREGRRIAIADTDLGQLGMMICHDYNHAELWERYAGKVDALLIMSCPPRMHAFNLVFPDGLRVNASELGPLLGRTYPPDKRPFGEDLEAHAGWLGVPVVNTVGSGTFRSKMPLAGVSLANMLMLRPDLWERLGDPDSVVLETGYDLETKIMSGGTVLARVEQPGDGFTLAAVTLADTPPAPETEQPGFNLSPYGALNSDVVGPALVTPLYRQGARRYWGAHMAPLDPRTKVWLAALVAAALIGWLLGRRR